MTIQYYYSPTTKGIYCHEAHGDNIPSDAVVITDELWTKKEQNPTYVFHYANNKLDVVHPDSLLSQQQLEERARQRQIAQANNLLNQSIKLESGVYQRRMTVEEQAEFIMWQDSLVEFIDGLRAGMPPTPTFIEVLL